MLEVVEDEQQPALAEVLGQGRGERPPALPYLERFRDRGHDVLRARDGREADEDGPVAELGLKRVRHGEAQACLARPSRAGERDELRALVAEERAHRGELEPTADERRRRHRQRPGRARRRLGSCEARILLQDRPLQLLQCGARVEAELFRQGFAGVAVDLERLGLAAAAVERDQPLLEESLAVRVLGRERLELGDDGGVPTAGEFRVVAKLERRQAQLLQPLRLGGPPRLFGEVGERRPAPHRERLAEVVRRVLRATGLESRPAAFERALEAVEVELVLLDDDAVSAARRLDPLGAERAPQAVHVDLERLDGGGGRRLAPQAVDQLLGRHDTPAVDEQQREQPALLRRAER